MEGSYLSIVTALVCVSCVVLLSTLNLLTTLYVAATVAGVLMLVVGTVVSMGWELGFLEGICFAILIGLSYASPSLALSPTASEPQPRPQPQPYPQP